MVFAVGIDLRLDAERERPPGRLGDRQALRRRLEFAGREAAAVEGERLQVDLVAVEDQRASLRPCGLGRSARVAVTRVAVG